MALLSARMFAAINEALSFILPAVQLLQLPIYH